jgi:hypothetical protein
MVQILRLLDVPFKTLRELTEEAHRQKQIDLRFEVFHVQEQPDPRYVVFPF